MDPNAAAAPPAAAQRKTSPWVYVGCGCASLLVLGALAALFVGKKIVDQGHKMEQGLSDPKVREQRTRELLSYRELPSGYYAAGAFSLPFVFDMAMLGDRPPTPGTQRPEMQEHGFIFMKMHLGKLPAGEPARRRMLFGSSGKAPWEQGSGFRLESNQPLGDGEVTAGGAHVLYRAVRGDVHMNNRTRRGITSIQLIECPDRRLRFGFWFGPDPAPGEPAAALDKSGTPADPQAIAGFLDHFSLCGAGS
jgi:hypothetical protein